MTEPYRIFEVPQWLEPVQLDRIERLNRRAKRAGIAEQLTWSIAHTQYEVKDPDTGVMRIKRESHIAVFGDLLKVPGYTFAATVDWALDKPLLRRNPNLPEEYVLTAPEQPLCEHCGTLRNRKDTYLVVEDATGTLKQVGSDCLMAYCGLRPGWVSLFEDGIDEVDERDDIPSGVRREWLEFTPEAIVEVAYCIVRKEGSYVSRKQADVVSKTATVDLLWWVIGRDEKDEKAYRLQQAYRRAVEERHNEQTVQWAKDAIAWAQSVEPGNSDFLYNVKVIAEAKAIGSRQVGLCAAIVPAYERDLVNHEERKQRGPAPIGSGIVVEGVIERMWSEENEFSYYGGTVDKMVVRLDNGSRVYSTVASKLYDMLYTRWQEAHGDMGVYDWACGQRVRFVANVEPSRKGDETTAYAKRPRKPEVLEGAA